MIKMVLVARFIAFLLFTSLGAGVAAAAGFDCSSIAQDQEVEAAICADDALSALDDQVTRLYNQARIDLASRGQPFDSLRDDQRAWLRERGVCGADVQCIRDAYQRRVAILNEVVARYASPIADESEPSPTPPADEPYATTTTTEAQPSYQDETAARPDVASTSPVADIESKATGVAEKAKDNSAYAVGLGLAGIFVLIVYMLPGIIALVRGHSYAWVILAVNLFAGWTGVIWIAMLVWAVWPKEKSLIDPLVGNVTGTGNRNAGDALGAVAYGKERGYENEMATRAVNSRTLSSAALARLERLSDLRAKGVLTDAEFQREKSKEMNG